MTKKDNHVDLNSELILNELLALLDKMSINVKYDRGNFQGGLVRYEDNDFFYINRKAKTETKINTIVDELKNLEIPAKYLSQKLKPLFKNNEFKGNN